MHNSEFMFIMQVELLKHDKALLEGPALEVVVHQVWPVI